MMLTDGEAASEVDPAHVARRRLRRGPHRLTAGSTEARDTAGRSRPPSEGEWAARVRAGLLNSATRQADRRVSVEGGELPGSARPETSGVPIDTTRRKSRTAMSRTSSQQIGNRIFNLHAQQRQRGQFEDGASMFRRPRCRGRPAAPGLQRVQCWPRRAPSTQPPEAATRPVSGHDGNRFQTKLAGLSRVASEAKPRTDGG
jgi:hypothetical protein